MFWRALEQLHLWERENLPGADTAVGNEVLVWLLKSKSRPRPLKDLYRSSRFSEPTIRNCLKEFATLGFASIVSNGQDMRSRFARATPKLEATVAEYRRRFQEVAELARVEAASRPPASLSPQSAEAKADGSANDRLNGASTRPQNSTHGAASRDVPPKKHVESP